MTTANHKIACLKEAAVLSPEYATIIPLFIDLFEYVAVAGGDTGVSFNISENRKKEQLEHGFPIVSPENVTVDMAACTVFLKGALYVLTHAGKDGAEELKKIGQALDDGALPLRLLFKAVLERDRATLDAAAESVGVPSPLLEYVCEIPLKAALEGFSGSVPSDVSEGWHEGYCPVCGSRAGMAELSGDEGKRYLCCSACTFRWSFKRLQCPYCGNDNAEKMSYFMAGEGATRVDTCAACSRYIKTRDSRKGNGDVPLDVEDLLTMHLDLLAAREGFERGK
jgi:FdhE protein